MISSGLPRTLPILNKKAVNKAIVFGLVVDAEINERIFFNRKSYFYPDLPKDYQTIQDKAPICLKSTLIEIVIELSIKLEKVAADFLQEIRNIVRFLNIGDANMEKDKLRCDANISIKKKNEVELSSKVEIKKYKPLNHVRRVIDFEFQRQFALVSANQ